MTKIIIQKLKNGSYCGFSCVGHAGYAEVANNDRDVVCAAVSVLVINTINSLEAFSQTQIQFSSNQKLGEITCRFVSVCDDNAKLLVDSMILGLDGISREYGLDFCNLKFEEV